MQCDSFHSLPLCHVAAQNRPSSNMHTHTHTAQTHKKWLTLLNDFICLPANERNHWQSEVSVFSDVKLSRGHWFEFFFFFFYSSINAFILNISNAALPEILLSADWGFWSSLMVSDSIEVGYLTPRVPGRGVSWASYESGLHGGVAWCTEHTSLKLYVQNYIINPHKSVSEIKMTWFIVKD